MFQHYRKEKSIFRFEDYRALMDWISANGIKSALEFGPGLSTFAMIEAGVERIVTCEYSAVWMKEAEERFSDFPQVEVIPFKNTPALRLPGLKGQSFDMAFVDSPVGDGGPRMVEHKGQEGLNRFNTLTAALKFAPIVLLHDARRDREQASLARLVEQGHSFGMIETRKGIAVITRKP